MYFGSAGMTMEAISVALGGKPCRKTISDIIDRYLREDCQVVVPRGRNGILHATRKCSEEALEVLIEIVQDEEQFLLLGGCRSGHELTFWLTGSTAAMPMHKTVFSCRDCRAHGGSGRRDMVCSGCEPRPE